MDFVRFTMRNPHLFQSAAESRCIIASDVVREAMYLRLLWNMRIILSWKRLRCLLSGQEWIFRKWSILKKQKRELI